MSFECLTQITGYDAMLQAPVHANTDTLYE